MNEPEPVVCVVDDDASVLKSLARLLRADGLNVLTFNSSRAFLDAHDPSIPGCLILDIAMPSVNGLELQQVLQRKGSGLPIIFLTGRGSIPMSVQAMKRGASDFLTKPVNDTALINAVRRALRLDRTSRASQAELDEIRRRLASLTPREHEVMIHVVAGKRNKNVAAELGTVEKTIKVHRARVMAKMQAASLAELVRLTERAGLGAPDAHPVGGPARLARR
jgi:FixJ family two-component response regulator